MFNKFLWGASTSAFQVEGAFDENGRGLAITDIRSINSKNRADTKVAMDHYHRYEEDILSAKELGLNSYRFSISWSRIFPNGDEDQPNQKGLDFYDRIVDLLLEYNIEPLVTIYHYDFPMGLLNKYGGWYSREMIDDFEKYAVCLFNHFKGRVRYWFTINEQGVISLSNSLLGVYDDDLNVAAKKRYQMNHHMSLGNAKVIKACHKILPDAKIGPVLSYQTIYPASCHPEDVFASKQDENFMTFYMSDVYVYGKYPQYYTNFLKNKGWMFEMEQEDEMILSEAKLDFLGVNWYCSWTAKKKEINNVQQILKEHPELMEMYRNYYGRFDEYTYVQNEFLDYTKWGWSIDPLGFRMALNRMYERYNLPLIITENGFGCEDFLEEDKVHDQGRINYLKTHIQNMLDAMNDGANIIGYCVWSMIDVLSSSDGISKRYGLVYVDRTENDLKDLKRIKKDSYYWYQDFLAFHK